MQIVGNVVSLDAARIQAFSYIFRFRKNVGDVSETPVIGASGLHIIRYESDVVPGAVPYEEIRDALYTETLERTRDDRLNEMLVEWTDALNAKVDVSKFTLDLSQYGY